MIIIPLAESATPCVLVWCVVIQRVVGSVVCVSLGRCELRAVAVPVTGPRHHHTPSCPLCPQLLLCRAWLAGDAVTAAAAHTAAALTWLLLGGGTGNVGTGCGWRGAGNVARWRRSPLSQSTRRDSSVPTELA